MVKSFKIFIFIVIQFSLVTLGLFSLSPSEIRATPTPSEEITKMIDVSNVDRVHEIQRMSLNDEATVIDWSPDGMRLAIGLRSGSVVLLENTSSGLSKMNNFEDSLSPVLNVTFSEDSRLLATIYLDGVVNIRDLSTASRIFSVNVLEDISDKTTTIIDAKIYQDFLYILTTYSHFQIWDIEKARLISQQTLERPYFNYITSADLSPSYRLIATGLVPGLIDIWDMQTGELETTLHEHSDTVWSLEFNAAGDKLLSSGDDNRIILWDLEESEVLQTFEGHTNFVRIAIFSANEDMIISSSLDTSVRFWDTLTGNEVFSIDDLMDDSILYDLEMDPTGRYLAIGVHNNVIIYAVASP
jgi:WD40 repeat protein